MTGLSPLDGTVIGVSFLIIAAIVWRSSKKQKTSTDRFVAERNLGFFAAGAPLLAFGFSSPMRRRRCGYGSSRLRLR